MMAFDSEKIREWLKPVEDPEMHLSLVELGLIYGIDMEPTEDGQKANVYVKMTLTSPGCPAAGYLVDQVKKRVEEYPDQPAIHQVYVELVWEPKWDPRVMASEECKDQLGIW